MTRSLLTLAVLAVVGRVTPGEEPKARAAPVALSAKSLKGPDDGRSSLEITLAIGPEFEIHSHRATGFTRPLTVELLDAQRRPIPARFAYPRAKRITSEVVEEFFVFTGRCRILARYDANRLPAYVRVAYGGYSNHGY